MPTRSSNMTSANSHAQRAIKRCLRALVSVVFSIMLPCSIATVALASESASESASETITTANADASNRSSMVSAEPMHWIPAITIHADEIDLLLDDQQQDNVRGDYIRGNHAASNNLSSIPPRMHSSSAAAKRSQNLGNQLVLQLLPVPYASSPGQSSAATFSWALLNGDNPGAASRYGQSIGGFSMPNGRPSGRVPLTAASNSTFEPQLNLGWQLGGGQHDSTFADPSGSGHRLATNPLTNSAGNQPMANIQCAQSVLTSESYSASGCRFTNINQQQIMVGLDWSPLSGLRTQAGFFDSSQSGLPGWEQYDYNSRNLAAARSGVGNLADIIAGSGQHVRGMQLGLQVELLHGANDLDISAGWSRITDFQLDAPFLSGAYSPGGSLDAIANQPVNQAVTQSAMLQSLGLGVVNGSGATGSANNAGYYLDSGSLDAATLQINWSNGTFSSGLQSIYQQTPLLPGISRGEDLTTFNLHFTWHTPWQGALSIGANNLLDSGATSSELQNDGTINSIYGRIPYVRYKQDL